MHNNNPYPLYLNNRKPTSPETVKGVISTAKTTCKTINTPWLGVGEEGEKARGEEESGEEVGAEKLASSSSSSPRSSLSSLSTSTVLCGGDVEMLVSHFPTKKYSSFELIQEKGTEINRIGYVLEGSLKVCIDICLQFFCTYSPISQILIFFFFFFFLHTKTGYGRTQWSTSFPP